MQEKKSIVEQDDTLQEIARGGGRISGKEGGLRLDVFKHDKIAYANGTDFSTEDCAVCELPETAQRYIVEDIEYEDSRGR
tara:strand:+ start:1064 stop:1303 length:240 start_codon:yes stop_codon:yes gene_type:complete